jgi:hypothetical protein
LKRKTLIAFVIIIIIIIIIAGIIVNMGSTYFDIDDRTDILNFKILDKFLIEKEVVRVDDSVVQGEKEVVGIQKEVELSSGSGETDHDVDSNDCNDDQLRSFRDLCPLTRMLIRSIHMLT